MSAANDDEEAPLAWLAAANAADTSSAGCCRWPLQVRLVALKTARTFARRSRSTLAYLSGASARLRAVVCRGARIDV